MSRNAIFLAAGIAVAVVAVALFALERAGHVEGNASLESVMREIENRLERLERALETAQDAPRRSAPASAAVPSSDGGEPPDDTEGPEAPASGLQDVFGRLDDLERRVRGLEVDPVQRGYVYLESDSAELRRQGVLSLERIAVHDEEARRAIRAMLQDPDARVRQTTIDTLADLGDKEAVPFLLASLSDNVPAVRRETLDALGRLEARDAGMDIAQLLGDPDGGVREEAADVLGILKVRGASDFLFKALEDPSERVRGEAIASLGEVGEKRAVPPLRSIYEKGPGDHRWRVVMALRKLGDEQPFRREVDQLSHSAVNDGDESARSRAIRTLAWIAREESQEVFRRALEDSSSRVRREAQRALGGRREGWRGGRGGRGR